MKRFPFILFFLILLYSCGPSRHAIPVEMRHPSKSGLDLAGKIISVVYSGTGDPDRDMFSENMADAFARTLEKEYGTGEGSVGLYSVDSSVGDYTGRDSLVNILMTTGADMVFLIDASDASVAQSGGRPLTVTIYCVDAMDRSDKVHKFSGSTALDSADEAKAVETGKRVAESFLPQWKQEQYSIVYYDSVKWYEALVKAEQFDWKGAMDIWFTLLDSNDALKRASAEYNIAVACYMLGDFVLAREWLDRSDAENRMPTLSDGLRKRIEARKL